jgi:Icc protein
MSVLRLVQFTDPHLYGSETETLRGIATLPALVRTMAVAQARDWPVDAVLVTGDLVQDDPAGYKHFRRLFSALNLPILCLPGNHDEPEVMHRELRGKPFVTAGHVDMGAWRIVLLDSCLPGSAHGRLGKRTLAALDSALSSADTRHTLVCLHHHPVAMSSRWLDQVGLENSAEFFEVIDRHKNVRAILWGHVHQSYDALRKNVRLLATPSTCAQFLPRADEFAVDARPPAYRTLELRPDGTLLTEVVWVDSSAAGSSSSSSVCSAA